MNEKMFAIIVLSLIIGLGLGYGVSYYANSQNLLEYQLRVQDLQTDFLNLTTSYQTLVSNYTALKQGEDSRFQELQDDYVNLQTAYQTLEANYTTLKQECESIALKCNASDTVAFNIINVHIKYDRTTFIMVNTGGSDAHDIQLKVTIGLVKEVGAKFSMDINVTQLASGEMKQIEVGIGKNAYPGAVVYLFEIQINCNELDLLQTLKVFEINY